MSEVENKPIKTLLVEDNPGDARLFELTLNEIGVAQFELTHAERLDQALNYLKEEKFDVVLLDLSLPDSQGMSTFTQIRSEAPDVPIIMLTGLDDENFALEAMQHGAQDYLVKGQVDEKLLTRSIKYSIERNRAENALRESEENLRRLAEENAMLAEISRIISSSREIDDVYERFAEEVRKLVPFDRIVVNLIDLEEGTYLNAYVTGAHVTSRQPGIITPLANTITGEIYAHERSLSVRHEVWMTCLQTCRGWSMSLTLDCVLSSACRLFQMIGSSALWHLHR